MPIRDVYALKMDKNSALQKRELFTEYLTRKGHRKTPERYAILDLICSINGHFDVDLLYKSLESANFHVSRATLYNTIELLVDSRLLVRHQFGTQGVQYECADRACTPHPVRLESDRRETRLRAALRSPIGAAYELVS